MNNPMIFWSAFFYGFGAGLIFVVVVASASTALLVYLLRNFGNDECAYDVPDKVEQIEDWR